jgi:hypothetical protein
VSAPDLLALNPDAWTLFCVGFWAGLVSAVLVLVYVWGRRS